MIWIGLDDTDNLESRGTGNLARQIAVQLGREYPVSGVTRHQLLQNPEINYTKNNSSAAIELEAVGLDYGKLFERVGRIIRADFQLGSDPGLCIALEVHPLITLFGRRAQREVLTQREALELAATHGLLLEGLGGDHTGVIGALAAVGLAASGEDGRYVQVGRIREMSGLQPVEYVLSAGVSAVQTREGKPVDRGMILVDKLRPARRGGIPVALVDWEEDHWIPIKLD